ncbi:MAG: hypothetical protein IJL73_06950 [Lachnospiraceae bacterium]|nr:hypothetical protein [Lachnospiraceae bacterium]
MIETADKTDVFLSGLNDEDLEKSWEEARANTRTAKRKAFLRKVPILAAAVLVLSLVPIGITIGIRNNGKNNGIFTEFQEKIAALGPVATDSSMANAAYVRIGDHVAMYGILPVTEDLSSYLGDLFQEGPSSLNMAASGISGNEDCMNSCDCSWYRLKGVRNLRYLLRKDSEGNLTAWRFGLFMSSQEGSWRKLFQENVEKEPEYGYRERLEVLCQAVDAKDIVRIDVLPSESSFAASSMPYSEGKEYTDEIGTKTIEDRRTITEILEIMKGMKDVPGTEDEILKHLNIFRSEKVKDIVETCYLSGELGPVTCYERNVRLVFSDGSSDLLSYTAVSGAFSYNGQKCIELSDGEMQRINELLGIDTDWDLPDDFGKTEAPDEQEQDGTPSDLWSDYDAGCYETPAGTVVVCVKRGGEAYADEITAYHLKDSYNKSPMPVQVRYVKYSRAEQIAAVNALAKQMRDPDSGTGYAYGISGFGVSEVYNKVNVYLYDFSEENIAAILAAAEDPDMVQFVYSGYAWIQDT